MQLPHRRHFMLIAIGACGPLGLGLSLWSRRPENAGQTSGGDRPSRLQGGTEEITQTSSALGSQVSITALHADAEVARCGIAAAMAELQRVDTLMSLYRPESQLCRLNRDGVVNDPHPDLIDVLRQAEAMSRRSGGAFDATVQPLWTLYAESQRAGVLPAPAALEAAVRLVDWRRVEVSSQQVRLLGKGVAVTLNGIAQGYAADRAVAVLRRHGIEHALVNSGEIASLGDKADRQPWTVGIQHPRRRDAHLWLARLSGRCLSTSGDYATSFSEEFRDNHLFDPRSGRSPNVFSSVSIAATTATEADALSTAVFVLGPEKGLELVRASPGADVLLVFKDGRTVATDGFPENV